MDGEAEHGVPSVGAIVRGRLAAIVDMRNGVHRPRGMPVLEPAASNRRRRGGQRGRRAARQDPADHAPPMPRVIRPVPSQFSQGFPSILPLPLHSGQMSSPVPGVPGRASSPGRGFGCCGLGLMPVPQQPAFLPAHRRGLPPGSRGSRRCRTSRAAPSVRAAAVDARARWWPGRWVWPWMSRVAPERRRASRTASSLTSMISRRLAPGSLPCSSRAGRARLRGVLAGISAETVLPLRRSRACVASSGSRRRRCTACRRA